MQLASVLVAAAALLAPVYSTAVIPVGSAANSINPRGTIDMDTCNKTQKAEVDAAVKRAASLSYAAADAALNGDANIFEYYFRTTDTATRKEVAARFEAVANESSSVNGGNVTYNCGNGITQSSCGQGVLAYAAPGKNMVVNCPDWYIIVPETNDCGGKDQGLAMLHELTHLGDVYSPPTRDIAYGYDAIINLSKEDAILNADTYNYYAAGEFFVNPMLLLLATVN
jgi:deuterolysin